MSKKQEWAVRIKVLVITAVIASIGNMLSTWHAGAPVMPWETIPALASMFVIVILGCLADELMRKIHISLPKILYISLFTMLLSIPGFSPIAEWMQVNYAKIGVLPLCTPILAYAGISIGKDMDSFKKQGVGIVLTSLMAFAGTYIGSAIIAEVLLKLTHVI